jgi:hypothetical protein
MARCHVGERERKEMPYAKSFAIAVVMLLLLCSQRAIAMEQQGMQESMGSPSSRSSVMKDNANTSQEPSPMLVAQWPQVPQANACACPAITCSELQRSDACQVSCARGRSAYCQCGSCNGISLSSPNSCGCR